MRVAYVEDDRDARSIFARKLAADGFACETFGDAETALSAVKPGGFDALIIDIRLPRLSGVQLLRRLRANGVHTPCILITAFNNLDYAREALNASANYLLEKPFSYHALRGVLTKVLEHPGPLQDRVDRGLAQLELTGREAEIARYLLKGLSNAEIAEVSNIAETTVKQYLTQIFQKANVSSRAELFSLIFPV